MTRFLVTGASGLLGLNFALQAGVDEQHAVTGVVNSHPLVNAPFPVLQADLTAPGAIERLLADTRPEVVINCAALALPDAAEKDPGLTQRLNVDMPAQLAAVCRAQGVRLVHISTDSVFDGQRGGYCESDAPNPLNVYARSKLASEQAVAAADPQALIARVVFYGWSLRGQRSLSEFFYYNLSAGRAVNGFTDVVFSPLQVNDLVDLLLQMTARRLSGLYHVFSPTAISKYDFGVAIARRFGLDETLVKPASLAAGGLAARRSPDLSMNIDRLVAALGVTPPDHAAGIDRLYRVWAGGGAEKIRALEARE